MFHYILCAHWGYNFLLQNALSLSFPSASEITLMYLILSSQLPSYIFLNDLASKCDCTVYGNSGKAPFLALLFNTRAFFILPSSLFPVAPPPPPPQPWPPPLAETVRRAESVLKIFLYNRRVSYVFLLFVKGGRFHPLNVIENVIVA